MTTGSPVRRNLCRFFLFPLLVLLAAASLLPLVETNAWWIRYLDFPRLQFSVAILALLVVFGLLRPRAWMLGAGLALGLGALAYNGYKLLPYARLAPEAAIGVDSCPAGAGLRIMVANVKKRNESADAFLDLVKDVEPDVLLVLETDAWWDRHLTPLRDIFSTQIQHIPESHAFYGMHLLSRHELVSPEFLFMFDAVTPTVSTQIRLPNGTLVEFLGLHPRPPQAWGQPTTLRDAHLLKAALSARESEVPSIVAGDLNAVPWERATRRTMRVGALLDPREGRGFRATYDANSRLMSWPLDQVLFQEQFAVQEFRVLPGIGSDHYPVLAELCHALEAADRQDPPTLQPRDLEESETAIKNARLMSRGN